MDTIGPLSGVAAGSKYLFGAVDDYSGKFFMMFGARKSDFKDFVETLLPPYTPQYNGRIEQSFAVITSMAMALLWNAGFTSVMKKKFLPEAQTTASFLNDLAPTARSKLSA